PHVPRQAAARHAMRGVETGHGDAVLVEDRLQLRMHVHAVALVYALLLREPERRLPPGHVMVAGNTYHPAHPLRVPNERTPTQKLARPGTLGYVPAYRHHVDTPRLDDLLDRIDLLRYRGLPEVQVGDVKDAHRSQAEWPKL